MNRTTQALSLLFVATEIIDQTDIHNYLLSLDDSVVEPPLYIPMKINRHRRETLLLVILGQFLAFLDQRLLARGKRCALAGRWRETNDKSTITGCSSLRLDRLSDVSTLHIFSSLPRSDPGSISVVHELPSSMPVGQSRILLCHHSQFALSLVSAPLLLLTRANTSRLTEIFRFFSSASTPLPVEISNRSLSSLGSMYMRKQFITKGIIFYGRTRL